MPIQFDNFDQNKIDRLKSHLANMAEKNKAKFFEIYVDNLKAVPKTDEMSDFDAYEDYINVDTEQIKIIIYNSALSPRNDQYVFLLKAKTREDAQTIGLSGVPLPKYSQTSISAWREKQHHKDEQQQEIQRLKREINDLKSEREDLYHKIEELETDIIKVKKNTNVIGGLHMGDILSVAVEGFVNRNKESISKNPLLAGLAGLAKSSTTSTDTSKEEETEVNFQKVENQPAQALTQEDAMLLELIKRIRSHFSEHEFDSLMEITDIVSKDKSLLDELLAFVNEQEQEEQQKEEEES